MIPQNYPAQRRPGPRPRQQASTGFVIPQNYPAQRRPGPRPRQQGSACLLSTSSRSLNEGQAETPATDRRTAAGSCWCPRSTRARTETPATAPERATRPSSRTSLNEGQGRDPGNSGSSSSIWTSSSRAQRRPGPRPRQQPASALRIFPSIRHAQRRPGPRPRQQRGPGQGRVDPSPHAQRRPGPRPRQQVHRASTESVAIRQRSTKARAETPATVGLPGARRTHLVRSTKRAETPATGLIDVRDEDDLGRSTKARAETPATDLRQPRRNIHRHRSTKARAETPATAASPSPTTIAEYSAHEGQGRDPGNRANLPKEPSLGVLRPRIEPRDGRNRSARPQEYAIIPLFGSGGAPLAVPICLW